MFGQWANFNSALAKTMSRRCLKAKLQQALGRINFVINSQSQKNTAKKRRYLALMVGVVVLVASPSVLHKVLSKCPA